MHKSLNIPEKQFTRPTKSFVLIAIAAIISLSCLLLNLFFHYENTPYRHKTLSLPRLNKHVDANDASTPTKNKGWLIITTHPGDSLASVFKHAGLSQQTLLALIHGNPHAKTLSTIKPNQQIHLLIQNEQLEKLIFPLNTMQDLVVTRESEHYKTEISSRQMDKHNQYLTATVRGSLYGTAQRLNIPYKLIKQMTDIFNWEIDFSKEVRAGDQFSIIYDAFYIGDKLVNTGDIVAVTYTTRTGIHRAIRHKSASGDEDYFASNGASLKKAFLRYPIKFSHISSTFSLSRQHPILHYSRPHKGVDLAAPIGTPIRATGDGRIQLIGRQNDYGNMIKISHNKMYTSIYGHLLKFERGLSRGSFVKRGQVIGYVGQSGLATGPHCQDEFHVNQYPKNPTTIDLPRASPVPAREMASFKANAGTLIAQLKLYEEGNLVATTGIKSINTG
jgi:murein DD-endopeptidase MepM/ murein hydrolase activator NlpD